jgi:hypothetical protein
LWNDRELKPECRDLIIPHLELNKVAPTFQHYTDKEIINAIENYHWHLNLKGEKAEKYPVKFRYPTFYGFLKTGAAQYFDDDALDQQFMRGKL